MKKGFSIVLLSLILLQVGGGYVYFIARLFSIRMEMYEQLKSLPIQELTVLTLSEPDYERAKVDDHEVKVDGNMYDIAWIEWKNDKVLVYAKHDDAEDDLLSFLEEVLRQSANDRKPTPNHVMQLMSLHFILIENELPRNSSVYIVHQSEYLTHPYNFSPSISSPPPRV